MLRITRNDFGLEAAETSNVSIPLVRSADSIAQLLLDDDPVDRVAVTDEIAKLSLQKDKV